MRSSVTRLLFCVVGGSALCSAGFGQIVKTKAGYMLRARYTKGMVINYGSTTSVKGGGMAIPPFHINIKIEVTKMVHGVATVKINTGKVMVNGKEVMAASSLEVPLDSRNTGTTKSTSSAIGPPLPAKAIRPGSSWEALVPVTLMGTTRPMNMKYQFSGMTQLKGQSMGLIVFTVTGAVEGVGRMYIRASDGTVESSEMTLSLGAGLTAGSTGMAQAHFAVKRL